MSEARAPDLPRVRLTLGVTGHRAGHAAYDVNAGLIAETVESILDAIAGALARVPEPFGPGSIAPVRLHSMLATGTDQLLAHQALARGWELVAPLPFGAPLNRAISSQPTCREDAQAILDGRIADVADAATAARAQAIAGLEGKAHLFELADDDSDILPAFLASFGSPADSALRTGLSGDVSERVALAGRLVIEQSDILIAIWDGVRTNLVGGTGHTIARALEHGAPVIWIDPAAPADWYILTAPEALASLRTAAPQADRLAHVDSLVQAAVALPSASAKSPHGHAHDTRRAMPAIGTAALDARHWRARSNPLWHLYRRVEALFGGPEGGAPWRSLRQTYETAGAVGTGSGAAVLAAAAALPGADGDFARSLNARVLARFAWADGISSNLSDAYRGGMMICFVLSALAVIGGIAYLPLVDTAWKWAFALFEFVLLSLILLIIARGNALRWHGRWFETRRAAEYLRHGSLLLSLGAARAPGRWPKGAETSWPEWYARQALREVGMPRVRVSPAYLRAVLETMLDPHVTAQRDYHRAKAERLARTHHTLDQVSELMFRLAVIAVAGYLILQGLTWAHLFDKALLKNLSKLFTFLGVVLPTIGGALAGMRYFGDFERFSAISDVTARKLDAVHGRIQLLLQAPDSAMDYGPVADIAHTADEIVVSEIENWQAVFGGKQITVPV